MNKSIKNKFKILKNIAADPDKKPNFGMFYSRKSDGKKQRFTTNPTNMPAISLLEFALGRLKSTPIFAMLLIFLFLARALEPRSRLKTPCPANCFIR